MSIAEPCVHSDTSIQSENIDHLGIVAAVARDLNIAGRINDALKPADSQRAIDAGTCVVAMIINGLGFTQRQLYLTPQYFENKPVGKLLGKGVKASMLTDHALGRALDDIAEYGATELFAKVSFQIAMEHNLMGQLNHLDSTSLSVHGRFEEAEDDVPLLTYGYSKDHRPDLKQVVMSLIVNGPAQMPLWMEALDGNSSDKTSFHETIATVNEFTAQLELGIPCKWVADSALYNKDNLLGSDYLWLTRVPETIKEAKVLVSAEDQTVDWKTQDNGYKTCSYRSSYGDCEQRWMLVYSPKAHHRESATFERKLAKQAGELDKELRRLQKRRFNCQDDAQKALSEISKPLLRYFTVDVTIEPIRRYVSKGRPGANSETKLVGYQVQGHAKRNEAAIEKALNSKGRFILGTNDLDEKAYPDEQLLRGNLCGLPLCQQQNCINEEIDAYLCTSSRLSSELRLCDIYAGRVFNSTQRAQGSSLLTELTR
ncbi:IS1634 family transposase [Granulosicoccus antarcticus]|uniref:DUF4277 domain-containing protein n=1 Tax=Granulosicoccus antarcticus IMCC3135 TaxID=1192854 RepID=A0A2Z2P0C7_9GAMM|nr:IS1634 family transposase [Granulosicoccus antarcticus]ASJ74580.1 hypothetical protein IMCC3135_22550 [Granulosicoccus antarcticus IMCC3135]